MTPKADSLPPACPSRPPRAYRGVSQEERRAERRRRLIAAAIEVYGGQGYRQSPVKAVCAAAGLTERYFYESFGNSEELLLAAYGAAIEELVSDMTQAARTAGEDRPRRAHAMLHAYFTALQRKPPAARLILVEIRGVSQVAADAYTETLRGVARMVGDIFAADGEKVHELFALGVVGGISQIALQWIQQGYAPPIEELIGIALRLGSGWLNPR
ncbi:TetR/AcrR family transcriptional regulator [Noviherbaspirillum malthae]|uniref:TetR/AcrR family transcriptional regulator n=1 Tax=Noviherbaspirillum malthae TaxID=1260987 RepID=UPI00188FBE77|nr:TetR/AcrR family transcriptional regulator [Noviherbaspirillum malthae]